MNDSSDIARRRATSSSTSKTSPTLSSDITSKTHWAARIFIMASTAVDDGNYTPSDMLQSRSHSFFHLPLEVLAWFQLLARPWPVAEIYGTNRIPKIVQKHVEREWHRVVAFTISVDVVAGIVAINSNNPVLRPTVLCVSIQGNWGK